MSTPRINLDTPDDLVQIVPYLLGFNPTDSVVLMVVRNHQVLVTARANIDDVQRTGQLEHLLDRLHSRYPDSQTTALAYSDDPDLAATLLHRCQTHPDTDLTCSVMVTGTTWSSGNDHGIVDRHGRHAAAATLQGFVARTDRNELASDYASPQVDAQLSGRVETIGGQLGRLSEKARLMLTRDLVDAGARGSEDFDTAERIRLGLLVADNNARDLATLSITNNTAQAHLQLWRDVATTVPAAHARQPMALAALAAWVAGDGARATIAIERAVDLAEQFDAAPPGLVRIVEHLIDNLVPPNEWVDIHAALPQIAEPVVLEVLNESRPTDVWQSVEPIETSQRRPDPSSMQPPSPGITI